MFSLVNRYGPRPALHSVLWTSFAHGLRTREHSLRYNRSLGNVLWHTTFPTVKLTTFKFDSVKACMQIHVYQLFSPKKSVMRYVGKCTCSGKRKYHAITHSNLKYGY